MKLFHEGCDAEWFVKFLHGTINSIFGVWLPNEIQVGVGWDLRRIGNFEVKMVNYWSSLKEALEINSFMKNKIKGFQAKNGKVMSHYILMEDPISTIKKIR